MQKKQKNTDDFNKIESLFGKINLGEILPPINKISGGLLHKLYRVRTSDKCYAVKVLNPEILKRTGVIENNDKGEILALKMKKAGINTSTAIFYNNSSVIRHDDSSYMIFEWLNGENYSLKKQTKEDCIKIGRILAKLHNLNSDTIRENIKINPLKIEWENYLTQSKSEAFYQLFCDTYDLLNKIIKKINDSVQNLSLVEILSHKDLDPKNWLEVNSCPYIIDWEAVGYINPDLELLDVALAWAGYEKEIDVQLFSELISAYNESRPVCFWKDILYTVCINRIEWLEYNIKRVVLKKTSDDAEYKIAVKEVFKSLTAIHNYYNLIPKLETLF